MTSSRMESLSTKHFNRYRQFIVVMFVQITQQLEEKFVKPDKKFSVVTFGDWPVHYQLPIECEMKSIKLPSIIIEN